MLRDLDLGSVSAGYSDRPVARAIKIKHAGLNLTDHYPLNLSPRAQARGGGGRVGPKVTSSDFYTTNHHPQPPSKCIGKNGNCQEVYFSLCKINIFTLWEFLVMLNLNQRRVL